MTDPARDIVERLRDPGCVVFEPDGINCHIDLSEVADEITSLRSEVERLRSELEQWLEPYNGFDRVQLERRCDPATLKRIDKSRAALQQGDQS